VPGQRVFQFVTRRSALLKDCFVPIRTDSRRIVLSCQEAIGSDERLECDLPNCSRRFAISRQKLFRAAAGVVRSSLAISFHSNPTARSIKTLVLGLLRCRTIFSRSKRAFVRSIHDRELA